MDDLFPLLLFLIFILAPLIESIRKKGQQQPPKPPPRRPLPGPPPARRSETEEVSSRSADSASTMIPDELWQILTGESRPYRPPPSEPEPQPEGRTTAKPPWDVVYIPPEEAEDEEAYAADDVEVETRRTSYEAPAQPARWTRGAPETLEEAPIIVSLETMPASAEVRHTAFHKKLTQTEAARPVRRARKPLLELGSRAELQRAFVLLEVLGRPRGLE